MEHQAQYNMLLNKIKYGQLVTTRNWPASADESLLFLFERAMYLYSHLYMMIEIYFRNRYYKKTNKHWRLIKVSNLFIEVKINPGDKIMMNNKIKIVSVILNNVI